MSRTAIVWYRRDLRIADNPALDAAVRGAYDHIVALFIDTLDELGREAPGAASQVWLHDALAALANELTGLGSRLILRRGAAQQVLNDVIQASGATAVYWNRLYEPAVIERDKKIKSWLAETEVDARSFCADVAFEPWTIKTGQGNPYKVFTPFWRVVRNRFVDAPLTAPTRLAKPPAGLHSESLSALGLLPAHPWANKIHNAWHPGEAGAHERLERFLNRTAKDYKTMRERPAQNGTSLLSPHLHFGEIGPRQIIHRVQAWQQRNDHSDARANGDMFLSEIGWREFGRHVLYHHPQTPHTSLDVRFADFPWLDDEWALDAWRRGRTGIPMVDAGMRELWATGIMHNRLRMTVASFLTKNLRIAWQHGERWFWDTLVDADLGSNVLGWQWAAGCGADAAPFFRIFNPVRQGQRFDPDGNYVKRWIPELCNMPAKHVHSPWAAPQLVLETAGVVLGWSYPKPIVDLKTSRQEALAAFETIKSGR